MCVFAVGDHHVPHREGEHFQEMWHDQRWWQSGCRAETRTVSSQEAKKTGAWDLHQVPNVRLCRSTSATPPLLLCPETASFCPLAFAPGGRVSNQTVHFLRAAHISETSARALLSFPFLGVLSYFFCGSISTALPILPDLSECHQSQYMLFETDILNHTRHS